MTVKDAPDSLLSKATSAPTGKQAIPGNIVEIGESDGLPSIKGEVVDDPNDTAEPKPDSRIPERADPSEPVIAPEVEQNEQDEELEIIMPSAESHKWTIGDQTYVQKPLSFFKRMQFLALVARALKVALDEGGAGAVGDILGGGNLQQRASVLGQGDIEDASSFMSLIFSLVTYAPTILLDSYCIWLNIPAEEQVWAQQAMSGELEGVEPLSDEDGKEIVKVFIVQNWGAVRGFFFNDLPEIAETARKQNQVETDKEDSPQSKPSKATQQVTPKQ